MGIALKTRVHNVSVFHKEGHSDEGNSVIGIPRIRSCGMFHLPEECYVVMMAFGLPVHLPCASSKCIVVPPINGEEFYEWLSDADCALLPYESKSDFNVLNCSPQKLFDCYMVGVPYIASNRPIVRQVLTLNSTVGVLCDFTNVNEIVNAIVRALALKSKARSEMRRLHRECFNYEKMTDDIVDAIEKISFSCSGYGNTVTNAGQYILV